MTQKQDILKFKANWSIPYTHTAGLHATKFFRGLIKKRLLGIRCGKCKRVLMPPRPFCERCFVPLNDWVEVKDTGEITALSINYMKYTGLPEPPYAIAFIKLDGADTSMMHFLGGVELREPEKAVKRLKIGKRVRAVWSDRREGRMTDILYFEPLE